MSTPVEAIPDGLTKQIKKVSAYRKNVAKVQINTASTAAATDTIEIQLPTKGIIDFTDLIFQASCTVTNTGQVTYMPEPEEFFRRVTLECDGATICDTDYYNDVFCLYKNATCSTSHARLRSCYSNDAFGYRRKLDSALLADATNAGTNDLFREISENTAVGPNAMVATNSTTSGFIIRDVYESIATGSTHRLNATVFLGIQNLGYIDASIMPSMRLKIQLANNNILGTSATVNPASFVLSQMTLLVPQLILPSYTNNLLQMLAPDQNGNSETLYYKFKRYLPYIFASNPSNINSLKFSLSSSSLDRLWLTMKGPLFGSQAIVVPGDPINYFKYTANDPTGANFAEIQYVTITIDNEALDGGVKDDIRFNGYIRNLQELALLNNTQFDNLIDSNFNFKGTAADSNTAGGVFARSEFKRCKWYYVKSLCYEGDNQALSGYNCMGSLANIQVDVEFDSAVAGALTFIVVAECSALLAVSAGRQVSLVL